MRAKVDLNRNLPEMTGIFLLGGKGKRLWPLTKYLNKHFLPVYNRPMATFGLEFLIESGISRIIVVTDRSPQKDFINLLNKNKTKEREIIYVVQDLPLGTAHAIKLCQRSILGEQFVVYFGDNIFEYCFPNSLFKPLKKNFCRLYLAKVPDAQNYGTLSFNKKEILSIEDKPKHPKSNVACTGCFVFKKEIFPFLSKIKPNKKNELDVMDLVRWCHSQNKLDYQFVKGEWIDAGVSFDHLLKAAFLVKKKGVNK